MASQQASELPSQVLRVIQHVALSEASPANRLLLVASMCGVCHQWRSVCCEVPANAALCFDSALDAAPPAPGGLMGRFRKVSSARKAECFAAVAKLLHGEAAERCCWPFLAWGRVPPNAYTAPDQP
jgi:hypothetical protein